MPTVKLSVPVDVKAAFNTTFEGQNKSAVIADLMREAVERILARRANAPGITQTAFRTAREAGRP